MVKNIFLVVIMLALVAYGYAIYTAPVSPEKGTAMCIVVALWCACVLIMIATNKEKE
jgi:hypothetical protein